MRASTNKVARALLMLVLIISMLGAGGIVAWAQDGTADSSEPTDAVQAADEEALRQQPDVASTDAAPSALMAPVLRWYSLAGAFFFPSSSSMTYSYGGVGCIRPLVGGQWRGSINVPDGSVLKYMYINYQNTASSGSSTLWTTRYRWNGTFNDLKSVNSRTGASTGAGFFYDVSTEITTNNTVDNLNYAYVFVWSGSTTQELCQAQVGYYPPAFSTMLLPMLLK